jgi:mannose-1-phosphate guanylyltransferase
MDLPEIDPSRELVVGIMAGGAGTRFWPASTQRRPKQFLALTHERSLLQLAFDRVAPLVGGERTLVLTQGRFKDLVREQLPELPKANVLGEPMRRDTAAAVALAAAIAHVHFKTDDGKDPILAILPSDHVIEPVEEFRRTLVSAARGARSASCLYTFGITPTYPATSYGYLELGDELTDDDGLAHHRLARFVEKPDRDTASGYVDGGKHLWNSGMFVWSTGAILEELERQLPEHRARLLDAAERFYDDDLDDALRDAFEPLASTSIDYGVLEGARDVRCVRAGFGWSDVGGFVALADHLPQDDHQNASRAPLRTLDAKGNIIFTEDPDERVALIGVDDLVVVRVAGRTLVAHKDRAEDIKKLVDQLPDDER